MNADAASSCNISRIGFTLSRALSWSRFESVVFDACATEPKQILFLRGEEHDANGSAKLAAHAKLVLGENALVSYMIECSLACGLE